MLGPEQAGLSTVLLERCDQVMRLPTRFALNLAVADALMLYDRLLQHGRFADRPVGSLVIPVRPASPIRQGRSRFRRTSPDWLADLATDQLDANTP